MFRPISSRCSANISATRCSRLALDLVWGYCGILSLGHGAFFALGGYAMGMYLMRQIGTRGVYGNRSCPISWCS
jgi:ABC-type branched-subunit amino acid transport system permease subunit